MDLLRRNDITMTSTVEYKPMTLSERLKQEKFHLEERLKKVTDALNVLEKHADVAEALEVISKI